MSNYGPTALTNALFSYFAEKSPEIIPAVIPAIIPEAPTAVCTDIMCKLEDVKDSIAPYIEKTGLSKTNSTYIASGIVGVFVLRHLYNRFGASTPYDLIKNIITKEFGKGSIADEIFKAFEKSIQDAIDDQIKAYAEKFPVIAKTMNVKERADFAQQSQQIAIKAVQTQLERGLKANKPQLTATAKVAAEASANEAAPVAPGTQEGVSGPRISAKAQAQIDLQKMVKIAFFIARQISQEATESPVHECSAEQKGEYAQMIRDHFKAKNVKILSCENREWNDSSMGLKNDGHVYLMVITPGAKIVADVDGVEHTLHVSDDGAVKDAGILAKLESTVLAALK